MDVFNWSVPFVAEKGSLSLKFVFFFFLIPIFHQLRATLASVVIRRSGRNPLRVDEARE